MPDELDPELLKAFSQARETYSADQFVANLLRKMQRTRRIRMWLQILAVIGVAIVVSVNMPLLLEIMAAAARFVAGLSPYYAESLTTPQGWAVSLLIGAWVLFRTRPSRR